MSTIVQAVGTVVNIETNDDVVNVDAVGDLIDVEVSETGQTGASAYAVWIASGHTGTIEDFLASLKGEKGNDGDDGKAATIEVGTVESGTVAKVENVGTEEAAIFDFTLPKGDTGFGVPPGGESGQFLTKKSESNYDTEWTDPIPDAVTSVNGLTGDVVLSIPSALSDLSDDETHRTVTDSEKTAWNGKANPGDIPTELSELSDDITHRTVTDTEKSDWNGKAEPGDIPTALSELTDDENHRIVTDIEKNTWNGKANPGDIPTSLSELSDDSTHRLVTDTEKSTWNSQASKTFAIAMAIALG